MKKYIGLVFLLILPYLFVAGMGSIMFVKGAVIEELFGNFPNFLLCLAIAFLLALIVTLITMMCAIKGKWKAAELAKVNMVIKILQIPAYALIFVTGIKFAFSMILLTPFAGILFVIFDCAVIFISGIVGAVAAWRYHKEHNTEKLLTILLAIGQFIFCVDVVCAIILFVVAEKN